MIFNVAHSIPGNVHADFILLPLGIKMNRDLLKYKKGDRIKMIDGSTHYIIRAGILNMDNPIVAGLCYLRYGITLKRMMLHWRDNAIAYGYGNKAVSDEECLLIVDGSKEDTEALVSKWKHVSDKMQVQGKANRPPRGH